MKILDHELRKSLTTPGVYVILAIMLVLCTAMPAISSLNVLDSGGTEDVARDYLFSFAGRSAYFAPFLLGALIVTNDFAHSTVWMSVVWFKTRAGIVVAKAAAAALLSALLGVIAVAVSFAVIHNGYMAAGMDSPALSAPMVAMGARTVIAFVIWGVFGVGLGLLLRSQVAAILVVFGIALFIEPVLTSLANENEAFATVGKFFPGAANWSVVWPVDMSGDTNALGAIGGAALELPAAVLTLTLYAVAACVTGYLTGFRTREPR